MLRIIFIILSVIVAVDTIMVSQKWNEISKFRKIFTVLGILAVLIGGFITYIDYKDEKERERVERKLGELETTDFTVDEKLITFEVGNDVKLLSKTGYFQFPSLDHPGSFFQHGLNMVIY